MARIIKTLDELTRRPEAEEALLDARLTPESSQEALYAYYKADLNTRKAAAEEMKSKFNRHFLNAGGTGSVKQKLAQTHQNICRDLLQLIFVNELLSPYISTQKKLTYVTRDKEEVITENRFLDVAISIDNPINPETLDIWKSIARNYDAKFIVFDAKNYNSPKKKIERSDLDQLQHYMQPFVTGKLGFILCRSKNGGVADNARMKMAELKKENFNVVILDDNDIHKLLDAFVYNNVGKALAQIILDEPEYILI